MLKRAHASFREIVACYEDVHGKGSALSDTAHALFAMAGFCFLAIFGGVAAGWLQ